MIKKIAGDVFQDAFEAFFAKKKKRLEAGAPERPAPEQNNASI